MFEEEEKEQKAVYKDKKTQNELNKPLNCPKKSKEQEDFLKILIGLIDSGKIELMNPDSLINQEIYKQLPEQEQGKTDLEAVNLLAVIRDIKGLFDNGFKDTFQMQNMVERLKYTKERLEEEAGKNLFII